MTANSEARKRREEAQAAREAFEVHIDNETDFETFMVVEYEPVRALLSDTTPEQESK